MDPLGLTTYKAMLLILKKLIIIDRGILPIDLKLQKENHTFISSTNIIPTTL